MKRIVLMLSAAILLSAGICAQASAKSMPRQRIINVVNGFRKTDGFEVVNIGRFGIFLMKSAAGLSADREDDPELRESLRLLEGINRLLVVEYEDGTARQRQLFNDRIASALRDCDLLMSARDESSTMDIYGTVDEPAGLVRDLVVFTPDDGALVCVFGKVSMDSVAKIMEMN